MKLRCSSCSEMLELNYESDAQFWAVLDAHLHENHPDDCKPGKHMQTCFSIVKEQK